MTLSSTSRKKRKTLVAKVLNCSGRKTVKVVYEYKKPHPLYAKEIKRKTVVHAHDEEGRCQPGDKVEIMSTRPLSRLKTWRITNILQQGVAR